MTEEEMVGWHHQLNGHEFEQAPGDDEGQGSLACCSPWGHKQLDMTEQLSTAQQQDPIMVFLNSFGDVIQPSYSLSSPSPLAFNLSQQQGLF